MDWIKLAYDKIKSVSYVFIVLLGPKTSMLRQTTSAEVLDFNECPVLEISTLSVPRLKNGEHLLSWVQQLREPHYSETD
jgi:hypothetical protein